MRLTLRERIERLSTPEPNTGCWLWLGSLGSTGYGHLRVNRRTISAARASYQAFKWPLGVGYEPDHLCRVRSCVNPEHLEAVTREENIKRAVRFRRPRNMSDVCKFGHLLDGNRTREGGGRYCRICVRDSKRRQRARKSLP